MPWTVIDLDADAADTADATDAPPENPRFCIRRLVANCCIDFTEASTDVWSVYYSQSD